MKLLLIVLGIPLAIVMVSKDPQAAADGIASLLVLGATLLSGTAEVLNEVLRSISG
ncbi:MAG TPA: hypothetical protein VI357_01635 [Mycobacteriales bacterium]